MGLCSSGGVGREFPSDIASPKVPKVLVPVMGSGALRAPGLSQDFLLASGASSWKLRCAQLPSQRAMISHRTSTSEEGQ